MSSLRSRQQRRKGGRTPAVLRTTGTQEVPAAERLAQPHGERASIGISWRAFSGLMVLGLSFMLVLFFVTGMFYVHTIQVVGADVMDESEVFRYADIANMHIFWVNPEQVRRNILESAPMIADARVQISWPPNMVRITIEEREPAVIWVQDGVTVWVDLRGHFLRFPPEDETAPAGLIRVITETGAQGLPDLQNDRMMSPDIVLGALQLQTLLQGVPELRYHPAKGLGFREGGGWDAWLGTGRNMNQKLLVYEALAANLESRGIVPVEINVADPAAAYYCGSIELCNG
jgi:cell division septal protein FtsQ